MYIYMVLVILSLDGPGKTQWGRTQGSRQHSVVIEMASRACQVSMIGKGETIKCFFRYSWNRPERQQQRVEL